jgi:hypothetical protein
MAPDLRDILYKLHTGESGIKETNNQPSVESTLEIVY